MPHSVAHRLSLQIRGMPSFDIVFQINQHELTNAVDQAKHELGSVRSMAVRMGRRAGSGCEPVRWL